MIERLNISLTLMHCYRGCFWPAVYYLDTGGDEIKSGGGEFMLEDRRYPVACMGVFSRALKDTNGDPVQLLVAIRPRAGLLVLFASGLGRSVRPPRGERERVSIALNLSPVPERSPQSPPS